MQSHDNVFVVTGGGSGIGRALVLQLLAKGASVAAVDINGVSLAETAVLAGELQPRLSTHVVDITDKEAVNALPDDVVVGHGRVDGLINNAGIIQPFVRIAELDDVAIARVMDVNFYGTLHMVRAFLPHLLQRPEAHIVNVSSMGGFLPVPGQTIYGAAKAAVKLLTEGLRSELMDSAVGVTVVFPGAIDTNIVANSGLDQQAMAANADAEASSFKAMPADEAAKQIIAGMEKNAYRILVGRDARMMDMLYRLHPKYAAELIFKQMKSLL